MSRTINYTPSLLLSRVCYGLAAAAAVTTPWSNISGFETWIPWRTLPVPQISGFAFAWLVATLWQPSSWRWCYGGTTAATAAWCSPQLTTIFHKMEKHGPRPWGTKPTSIPLGEKTRAHRHYTTMLPPKAAAAYTVAGLAAARSGRPEPKRQLETTAGVYFKCWSPRNTCCTATRYRGTGLTRLNGSPANLEVKGLSTSSVGENPTYSTYLPGAAEAGVLGVPLAP